ncbi:MAG: CPBP family glutamic-type intramembrane protease [Myxococcaceae bacterium]
MEKLTEARTQFHLALGSIFFPCVGIPLTLAFAFGQLARTHAPEVRRWGWRLLALALADLLLIGGLFATLGRDVLSGREPMLSPPASSRRVIGIAFEGPDALTVREVIPGGPASRAGVEPGDVVKEADGSPLSTLAELHQEVQDSESVELVFERDGELRTVRLHPVDQASLSPAPGDRGLFTPTAAGECSPFEEERRFPWAVIVAGVVVVTLHLLGRRRGGDATLLWAGALLLVVGLITEGVSLGTCVLVGGSSPGVMLVGVAAQTVVLLLGGWILYRRFRPELRAPDAFPVRPLATAVALGAWYLLTGAFRVGGLALIVSLLVGADPYAVAEAPLQSLATKDLGPLGIVLFVVPVVLLAPLSEELLFRGILLPWLSRWMPAWGAIAVSGVLFGALHFHYGLFLVITVFYGLVLGWARVSSRSLRAPILLHMLINGVGAVALLTR